MKDDRAERRREKANRPTVKYLRNSIAIFQVLFCHTENGNPEVEVPYNFMPFLLILPVLLFIKGIEYFITPNWTMLGEPRVWGEAAVQVCDEFKL